MSESSRCPRCGREKPPNAPGGACPACLLELALEHGPGRKDQPDLPDRADHRLNLRGDFSDVSGSADSTCLLNALDESIGEIPRILLRDRRGDQAKPVKTGTDELRDLAQGLSRYQLLGEIARGGMGVVLKGRDADLGRDLAVKVLLEKHRNRPEMLRRFVEEAQIGGQLQHPGIVPVYELGQFADHRLYIAMKLVGGRTLAALLESRQGPNDDQTRFLAIFEQVCQTIAYAHSRGVIHRDLKPSNVMVGSFGEVQVMDWGLAKVLDQGGVADEQKSQRSRAGSTAIHTLRAGSDLDVSHAGSVMGTPPYMSPEQARGELETVDERADVFGLGSILCEILTGHPAYTGSTHLETYRKAEKADLLDSFARLESCGADSDLVGLARACLAPAAKDRPRDAGVVAARLADYRDGVQSRLRTAELAQAHAEAKAAEARKRSALSFALAAAVLVIAVLGGGGWTWVKSQEDRRQQELIAELNGAIRYARGFQTSGNLGARTPLNWDKALEAAEHAVALASRQGAGASMLSEARAILSDIKEKRQAAAAAEKNQRMIERTAEIYADLSVHQDPAITDDQFAEEFRRFGVDVKDLSAEDAGARLAKSPIHVELAGAIDQWTTVRYLHEPAEIEAVRKLVAIAELADPDAWRNGLRETIASMMGKNAQARVELEKLAETADPDSLDEASITRLAGALMFYHSKAKADELLTRAQFKHPDGFWINRDLAQARLHQQRYADAIRFYSAAIALRPTSALALTGMASALYQTGEIEQAAETLRLAVKSSPNHALTHARLGAVLMDLGETAAAEVEFNEAKRLQPKKWMIRFEIAAMASSRGDWNRAIAELDEGARVDDQRFGHTEDMLGMAYLYVGRYREAIDHLQKARLRGFEPAYGNLRLALAEAGDLDALRNDAPPPRKHSRGDGRGPRGPATKGEPRGPQPDGSAILDANSSLAGDWFFLTVIHPGRPRRASGGEAAADRGDHPGPPGAGPPPPDFADHPGPRDHQPGARDHDRPDRSRPPLEDNRGGPGGPPQPMVDPSRIQALIDRLAGLRDDEITDPQELMKYARAARFAKDYARSVRLRQAAFARDESLADRDENRYRAACLAIQASVGAGQNPSRLDASDRTAFRLTALAWLERDLAEAKGPIERGPMVKRAYARLRLGAWFIDPALNEVRDKAKIAGFPADERTRWETLWKQTGDLLAGHPSRLPPTSETPASAPDHNGHNDAGPRRFSD